MPELVHGKIMHLVDQNDYDILQRYKQDEQNNGGGGGGSDEIRAKEFNEKFLQDKNEEKFKEDYEWEKLGKRLAPIIHPDSSVTNKSNEEVISIVTENLPDKFKNKGKIFLKRLLREDNVAIDSKYIYLDRVPLKHDIVDIVDGIVRTRKKLSINLDT